MLIPLTDKGTCRLCNGGPKAAITIWSHGADVERIRQRFGRMVGTAGTALSGEAVPWQ
jgi:hypothetical protein